MPQLSLRKTLSLVYETRLAEHRRCNDILPAAIPGPLANYLAQLLPRHRQSKCVSLKRARANPTFLKHSLGEAGYPVRAAICFAICSDSSGKILSDLLQHFFYPIFVSTA
jgi:hypothetical protein